MIRLSAIGLFLACASLLPAQTVNVRGKISNGTGQAVDKAVVELVQQGIKDTTGPDGMYSLARPNTAIRSLPKARGLSLEKGKLQLVLTHSASVIVEVFDLHGNQLRREADMNASAGTYLWDFTRNPLSNQMIFVKARVGNDVQTFTYTPSGDHGSNGNNLLTRFTSASPYLAKVAAVVDTLRVTATGYKTLSIPVGSLDTTANVTLESGSSAGGNSAGCGKTSNLKTGKALSFTPSGGQARTYNLRIPDDYKNDTPYRLIVSIHWLNGTANNVSDGNSGATNKPYYGIWELANPTGGKSTTIFVAPQGLNNSWPSGNVPFITSLVNMLKSELCIDTNRIFAEGFSMGGSMSYALACGASDMFRGVAVHSGGPMSGCEKTNRKPVAYFMTHGTADSTCKYPAYGVPQVNDYAKLNGCQDMDIPSTLIPTDKSGMNPKCADYTGCSAGYPTRACIFVGPHTPTPGGANSWVPGETWKFISQF